MSRTIRSCLLTALLLAESAIRPLDVQGAQQTHNLETPRTYCDDTGYARHDGGQQTVDTRDGRLLAVGPMLEGPYSGVPEEAAWEFLKRHADWVGIEPTAEQLKIVRSVESPGGYHVTFDRQIDGIPVYPGNLVVTFDKDFNARFFANGLILFKEKVSTTTSVGAEQAKQLALAYIAPQEEPVYEAEPELVIWAGDNRDVAPCWRYRGNHTDPYGDWEVLVDARTGAIRRVRDRAMSVNGTGQVFDPDPITTAGVPYGSPGLVDNNDANSTQLTNQRVAVTLFDITDVFISGNHFYYLVGPYANNQDYESPNWLPVVQVNTTNFNYTRDNQYFEEVVCYYHIDKSQRWIQSLGFTNVVNSQLEFDAHAENRDCNAHYHPSGPGGPYLSFGDGDSTIISVDGAEDGEIIWHEYGHAINDNIMPWWGGSPDEDALGEGWSDYWAASYGRSISNYQATWIGSWGLRPCFGGRSLLQGLHYPEDAGDPDPHWSGMIWSQALYQAEVNSGNRTAMNRIGLQHQFLLADGTTMPVAAQALITADQLLYSGQYAGDIADACVPRGLLNRPSNDYCPGTAISSLPFTQNTSTAFANNDHVNCVGVGSPDIFYHLEAQDCAQLVTVDLCATHPTGSYDSGLEVRSGGACPGTTLVICNDDACGINNRQSRVEFVAAAATDYYFIIHGFGTYAGPVVITVTGQPFIIPPPNEQCPGNAINSLPYSDNNSTCYAVNNYPNCVGASSPDVVYTMELTSCQLVTMSLCGASFDTGLEVRTGASCPGTSPVACNDDACGLSSEVQFAAIAYRPYYIIVHGYSANERGNFVLHATGVPLVAGNDSCPGAFIASLPYADSGSTYCSESDWSKCNFSTSRDVVYRYFSNTCQTLSASLCGSSFDTQLEVRRAGSCPGVYQVACSDDYCGLQSFVQFPATEGVYYYFIVHGYGADAGSYVFSLTSSPGGVQPNDVCAGSYNIGSLPYLDLGSTTCATNNRVNCVGGASREVFYTLNVESCSDVVARLCNSLYDTGLEVRTGGACPGSTLVGCNDDNLGCNPNGSFQSIVQFRALPGADYFLIVHGFATNYGPYVLDVAGSTCVPESLVVQRMGNNAYLDWAPVAATGAVTYRVYRATTPDVPIGPANLIATTANAFYSDVNVIGHAQLKFFYRVTADGVTLLSQVPLDEPSAIAVEFPNKIKDAEMMREMRTRDIPAYIDPADIEAPRAK